MGILLPIANALVMALMAYEGVHVTLHPPTSAQEKTRYKRMFLGIVMVAILLIGWQALLNRQARSALERQLAAIQRNMERPPVINVKVPAPKVIEIPATPKLSISKANAKAGGQSIESAVFEARMGCILRNTLHLPENSVFWVPETRSFLDGPEGKSYLAPYGPVLYSRAEEEGMAVVVQKYAVPSNSPLIGRPVSYLERFDIIDLQLTAADGDDFKSCYFIGVTISLNGHTVFHRTKQIPTEANNELVRGKYPVLRIHLKIKGTGDANIAP